LRKTRHLSDLLIIQIVLSLRDGCGIFIMWALEPRFELEYTSHTAIFVPVSD